jgi:rfaE bifunctional protein nucleotidyltransferase chain/domain
MEKGKKKVLSVAEAVKFAAAVRRTGKTVVTTNGCFDVLHVGHLRSLRQAKAKGDVLIVGINSDASVRALKGKGRPIVPARERAEMVAALEPVDAVVIFNEKDPRAWLAKLRPNVHTKGSDRKMEEILEREIVEKNGGAVVLLPIRKGKSTTDIIQKIRGGRA